MSNKKIILITIVIIALIIIFSTSFKIYQNYNENLIKVVENEFLYQAKKCFNEDICSTTVYLSDLYKEGYLLEKLSDPITKKYYSEKSYINLETKKIKLIS